MFPFTPSLSYGTFQLYVSKENALVATEYDAAVYQVGFLNEWATSKDDRLNDLRNGDMLVIFADNAAQIHADEIDYRRQLYAYNKARFAERKELHDDLFGDWDVMSLTAQIKLKDDPVGFLDDAFPRLQNVPPVWRNAEKHAAFDAFLKGTKEFAVPHYDLTDTSGLSPVRDDILYAGVVELDDDVYGVQDGDDLFFFQGLQTGFKAHDWGMILKKGHKALVMRSEPGLA